MRFGPQFTIFFDTVTFGAAFFEIFIAKIVLLGAKSQIFSSIGRISGHPFSIVRIKFFFCAHTIFAARLCVRRVPVGMPVGLIAVFSGFCIFVVPKIRALKQMAGIYIHIPFCASRCDYCAFYSTVSGAAVRQRYVARLCREIEERSGWLGSPDVSTIYIGGGTPSQLDACQLHEIFGTLSRCFRIAPGAEVTMEVNPDDITRQYAASLARLPVNRISMGVQSLDDRLLRAIHRRHSAARAGESFGILREAGFENISLDLIYALPGETLAMWESDLDRMVGLGPEHISAYALSIEEGTPLYARMQRGGIAEADEELYAAMYASLSSRLAAAGYEHYEISNFALPGKRAVHNASYWKGDSYLGIGAGAHSFNGISRRVNLPDVQAYIGAGNIPEETETLSAADKFDEMVMTRLRTCEGLELGEVERRFGRKAVEMLLESAQTYIGSGRLRLDADGAGRFLRLTASGILVSDGIMADLMNPDPD
jgi:putative oxygen-independent coproporphyrinogen III oxidase